MRRNRLVDAEFMRPGQVQAALQCGKPGGGAGLFGSFHVRAGGAAEPEPEHGCVDGQADAAEPPTKAAVQVKEAEVEPRGRDDIRHRRARCPIARCGGNAGRRLRFGLVHRGLLLECDTGIPAAATARDQMCNQHEVQ